MKQIARWRYWSLVFGVWCWGVGSFELIKAADAPVPTPARWESAIQAFEAADRTNPAPRGAVLLVGSSSIRLWTNAPAQFPRHKILNRGFGGSHLADVVAFVDRIVIPYQPRLIVLYAGDNDIAAGKTPEQVAADFRAFVSKVRAGLPTTPVIYLAIKPSPARLRFLAAGQAANRLIQEFMAGQPGLKFVDVATPMLDAQGQPRAELFLPDRLHLNETGYKLWAGIVGPVLDTLTPPERDNPGRGSGNSK